MNKTAMATSRRQTTRCIVEGNTEYSTKSVLFQALHDDFHLRSMGTVTPTSLRSDRMSTSPSFSYTTM